MPTRPPSLRPSTAPTRRDQNREHDRRRGTPASRGYDAAWRRLRKWHLDRHPLCAFCEARGYDQKADVVDHIVPIAKAPERRLDPSNLQSLCASCHSAVKQREERSGAAPVFGGDGWPV